MKSLMKTSLTAMMLIVALMLAGCQPEDDPQNGGGDNNGGDPNGNNTEAVIDGHAYVDLGLPSGTLWATCNIGAERPEGYGKYFAWGETSPKPTYDYWNYVHSCFHVYGMLDYNDEFNYAKYCSDPAYAWHGVADTLTMLESVDDAAAVNWGGGWHVPSLSEMSELFENCSWSSTTQGGVRGLKVTASNGNSLFFPAAGYRYFQLLYEEENGQGFYWMNQTFWNDITDAWSLYFDPSIEPFLWSPNTEGTLLHHERRYRGFSVRPVHAAVGS